MTDEERKAKRAAYKREWAAANPERVAASRRKSEEKNREARIARYESNKVALRARAEVLREPRKAEARARASAWYEANKDRAKAVRRAYRESHKVEIAQKRATEEYRARERAWRAPHQARYNVRKREVATAERTSVAKTYVAKCLGLHTAVTPDALYETYRQFLINKRKLKEIQA